VSVTLHASLSSNCFVFFFFFLPFRPALAAVRDIFPEYFYPNETVNASAYDGLMAYADYRGHETPGQPTGNTSIPFDVLQKIGMKTNWDASFPFQGGE